MTCRPLLTWFETADIFCRIERSRRMAANHRPASMGFASSVDRLDSMHTPLPLDALDHDDPMAHGILIAHPLVEWSVENIGAGLGLALHLRDDRKADAAFHVEFEQAIALHRALGEAIVHAAQDSAPERTNHGDIGDVDAPVRMPARPGSLGQS